MGGSQFNWNENLPLQMKFVSYGMAGGFYFSSIYPRWMKYSWIFINFADSLVLLVFGTIPYLISRSTKKIEDIIYALVMTNLMIMVTILQPFLTYYFKNEIEEVLTLNEKIFVKNIREESAEIEESKSRRIQLIIWLSLLPFCYFFSPALQSIFLDDADYLNNSKYYPFAHIWLGQVQTQLQYYTIILTQFIPTTISLLITVNFGTSIFSMGHEFHVALSKLQSFLKDVSESFEQNIEQIYKNEVHSETPLGSRWQGMNAIEYNREQLMIKVVTAIQAHQCVLRSMKLIKPLFELIFTVILFAVVIDQYSFTYLLCTINMNTSLKIREILALMAHSLLLFTNCYIGKLLDNKQEQLTEQVYDIPWYDLNPQQRKMVYICLCQTQKKFHYRGFKVYAMNMPIVLQVLRMTYSAYNIFQIVLNK